MSHLIIYLFIFSIIGCAFVFGGSSTKAWPSSFNIWYSVQAWTFIGILSHYLLPDLIPPFKGFMPGLSFVFGMITVILAAIYAGKGGLAPWLLAAIIIFSSLGLITLIYQYFQYREVVKGDLCKYGPRRGWTMKEIEAAFQRYGMDLPADCEERSNGMKTWKESIGIRTDEQRNQELSRIESELQELEAKKNDTSLSDADRIAAGRAIMKKKQYKSFIAAKPKAKIRSDATVAGLAKKRQEGALARERLNKMSLEGYKNASDEHQEAKTRHQKNVAEEENARRNLEGTINPEEREKAEQKLAASKAKTQESLANYKNKEQELTKYDKQFGKSYQKAKLKSCQKDNDCTQDEMDSLRAQVASGASRSQNSRDVKTQESEAAIRDHYDKKRQFEEDRRTERELKIKLSKASDGEKARLAEEVRRQSAKTDTSLAAYKEANEELGKLNTKESKAVRAQNNAQLKEYIQKREETNQVPSDSIAGSGTFVSQSSPNALASPRKPTSEAMKMHRCESADQNGDPLSAECKRLCDDSADPKPDFCDSDVLQTGGGKGPSKETDKVLEQLENEEASQIYWDDIYQVFYNFTLWYIFGFSDILFGVIWLIIALVAIGQGDYVLTDGIGAGVTDFITTGGEDGGPLTLWEFIVSWKWQLLISTIVVMCIDFLLNLGPYLGAIFKFIMAVILIVVLWLIFGHPILHLISSFFSWVWGGVKWIFTSIGSGFSFLFSSLFSIVGDLSGTLFG